MDESLLKLKNYMSSPGTESLDIHSLQELNDWIEDQFRTLKAENNPENLEKISQLENVLELLDERWVKRFRHKLKDIAVIKDMIQ